MSSQGPLRDGKPDGYWKTYSPTGVLKSEGNRKNFQLDSVWKFYNEKGITAFEFNYKDGKKNGLKKIKPSRNNLNQLKKFLLILTMRIEK